MTQAFNKDLIQQMMQPGFYPHPVTEPIQLNQTHISYILLTGDYAYKLKKPLNLEFLDFSTLEARHHFCLEELRLNQPYAPKIYLEVLPITRTNCTYRLGGSEPVEFVLKMRQFPQEALLINLLNQGKLTEAHLEQLGQVVARFHAQSSTNDYILAFGKASRVRQAIDDNYRQTHKYIGDTQTQQQFEETQQFTDSFFFKHQDWFAARQAKNRIRECHGDLHLGNICLWQDEMLLFDRIEFNEPFRFVDVMYDVAFVVMDLEANARKDLGNVFLNTYVEQTGDWEGLKVLPLYLCRQAYVRAKVNNFLLDDSEATAKDKDRAEAIAAHYYRLAWQYTCSQQGRLILMSGLSGSGKTTVAQYLARCLGAIHLRSDAVRKHLAGIPLEQSREDLYTTTMTQKTYERLLELGTQLASQGFPVILDAKYDRHSARQAAIAQAQRYQLPLQILNCTAPERVLQERLRSRTHDISDATIDLLRSQRAAAEPFTDNEKPLVLELDTTQNWQSQVDKLVECPEDDG